MEVARFRAALVGTIALVASASLVGSPVAAQADTEAPGAPRAVQFSVETFDLFGQSPAARLVLSWTRATDNTGIATYRILLNGELLQTSSGAGTSVQLDNVPHGSSFVQLQAIDVAGNESVMSRPLLIVNDRWAPSAPVLTGDSEFNATTRTLTVTHEPLRDQTGVVDVVGFVDGFEREAEVVNATTSRIFEVPTGEGFVQLVAQDGFLNESVRSAPIRIDAAPRPPRPPTPTGLNVSPVDGTDFVNLSWDPPPPGMSSVKWRNGFRGEIVRLTPDATDVTFRPSPGARTYSLSFLDELGRESAADATVQIDGAPVADGEMSAPRIGAIRSRADADVPDGYVSIDVFQGYTAGLVQPNVSHEFFVDGEPVDAQYMGRRTFRVPAASGARVIEVRATAVVAGVQLVSELSPAVTHLVPPHVSPEPIAVVPIGVDGDRITMMWTHDAVDVRVLGTLADVVPTETDSAPGVFGERIIFGDLEPGTYEIALAAIDNDGDESAPSPTVVVTIGGAVATREQPDSAFTAIALTAE